MSYGFADEILRQTGDPNFHPVCRLCLEYILLGQEMIEVQHTTGDGYRVEFEHGHSGDCK
jgi:hypothetical protein